MRLNTQGLIVREFKTGESDRLVSVLTRDKGLVKAFVRGGHSLKSKNLSATQLLAYSDLSLFIGRDTCTIDEAVPIEIFYGIRNDIIRTALAQYFCQLIDEIMNEDDDAGKVLSLTLNSLSKLADNKLPPIQLKAIFEMRLMCLTGFMPDVTGCSSCGNYTSEKMFFDTAQSCLVCGDCIPSPSAVLISNGVLASLRHICLVPPEKLYSFRLSNEGLKSLGYVCEKYILSQTRRGYSSLDFYKTVSGIQ